MKNSLRECDVRCGTSLMYRLWGRTSQKYVLRSTSHKKFATQIAMCVGHASKMHVIHHKPVIHKSWSTYRIHMSELLRRTSQSTHAALPAIRQRFLREDHIPAP